MGWILWSCFIVFVIYPLSTGPVILILERLDVDSDLIEAIYAPLILVADTFEPVEDFFMWYLLGVWGI